MKQALIVFTDLPIAGRTMTELRPYYDKAQCAGLHEAFLKDIYEVISDSLADLFVIYTGGDEQEAEPLKAIYEKATFMEQKGVTFEGRLYDAFSRVAEMGYTRILLMESSVTDFDGKDINKAFDILTRKDFVFAPLDDGSYWMIGAKVNGDVKALKPLFTVDFTDDDILESTIEAIPRWMSYDVLEEEKHVIAGIDDLLIFREGNLKANTAAFLDKNHVVSVIVPVQGSDSEEAKPSLIAFMNELAKFRGRAEIIISYNGETAADYEVVKAFADGNMNAKLVRSGESRGAQMNAGAESANGDILMFLQPDAKLPSSILEVALTTIDKAEAGYFPIDYPNGGLALWYGKRLQNKAAANGVIGIEHGIFMKRDTFYNSGMFKEIPAMEDIDFSRTLKSAGVSVKAAGAAITPGTEGIEGGFFKRIKAFKQIQEARQAYLAENK